MKSAMEMIEELIGQPLGGEPRSKLNGHAPAPPIANEAIGVRPYPATMTDQQILERAFQSANGARLKRLLDGDTTGYVSGSEADLAAASDLGFWFWLDPVSIENVMRESPLRRDKWDTNKKYLERTIARALAGKSDYYGKQAQRPDMSAPEPAVRDAKTPATRKPTKQGKSAPTQTSSDATNYLVGPVKARPTREELLGVPYKPKMIVENYLQQDAGGDVGTGGTGKTTLILWEGVHIILGRPLYGRRIVRPGAILIITAEDSREITLSRLNQVCNTMGLTTAEQKKVLEQFYVEDVSATDAKIVVADRIGVHATTFVDEIIDKYRDVKLAFVSLDPTSLLGPGELSANDGMAQLMRTARTLNKGLNAAVRLVHHVAQVVARSGIHDQYAGRGGTAFADNSRSQRQIDKVKARKFDHDGSHYEMPAEISDIDIAKGNVLAIYVHKLSYSERDSTPIIVVRNGFAFRHVPMERVDNSDVARGARCENEMWRVVDFVRGQLALGKKLSKSEMDLHKDAIGLNRIELRGALTRALNCYALVELPLPKSERITKRNKYLSPAEVPNPANPAESRHNPAGRITKPDVSAAANLAADGTSTRRRDSKAQRTPKSRVSRKALSGESRQESRRSDATKKVARPTTG